MSKLDVLILDGNSSHGWPELSLAVRSILMATGRFKVDVSSSPPQQASEEEWSNWRPGFKNYAAIISIYEGRQFSAATCDDFEAYIDSGHGAVILHSCVAAFPGWKAYNEMIGVGWRSAERGYHVFYDDAGDEIRTPPFHGVGPGHGKQHAFAVRTRQAGHPIMQGLPDVWMHGKDELYHGMRGPAKNMDVLCTAYSAKDQWGSGDHEPMLWTTGYGKGRVVTSVLGHRFYDERKESNPVECENGDDAVHCVGYQTLLSRSVEWAATNQVTLPVPAMFPNVDKTSIQLP
jgi:type 1 glutamine amidotransferase